MDEKALVEFVNRVARLVKDGEYLNEYDPEWDMPSDQAYNTLHDIIDEARALTGYVPEKNSSEV